MNKSTQPTKAFVIAAILSLLVGTGAYLIGLYNAGMALNEKGYYLTVLLFGLFAVISLQKTVRDRMEGIRTTRVYYLTAWIASGAAIVLLSIGLINAQLLLSEKGFFAMAYTLSLFAAITVQKNVRDSVQAEQRSPQKEQKQTGSKAAKQALADHEPAELVRHS